MAIRRAWEGEEWQEFGLRLIRCRHLPQNVQSVPDKVQGDAGIECFSTDGCAYQCFAPQEVSDTAKAASAMKAKATEDLGKLKKYETKLVNIMNGIKIKRWILLCPFLDDKDVVAHVRKKGELTKALSLPFIDNDFHALVHRIDDFAAEYELLRQQSMGVPVQIQAPSAAQIATVSEGNLAQTLQEKLDRAYAITLSPEKIDARRNEHIRSYAIWSDILSQLRLDHPALWERAQRCITSEERRLALLGSAGALPGDQLRSSVETIEMRLRQELPGLDSSTVTEIALGTVSEWLMRCPLDF